MAKRPHGSRDPTVGQTRDLGRTRDSATRLGARPWLLIALVSGCQAISGVDELEFVDDAGSQGGGGSGGSGGTAGAGGGAGADASSCDLSACVSMLETYCPGAPDPGQACNGCACEITACGQSAGCLAIRACMRENGCATVDQCNGPGLCATVIGETSDDAKMTAVAVTQCLASVGWSCAGGGTEGGTDDGSAGTCNPVLYNQSCTDLPPGDPNCDACAQTACCAPLQACLKESACAQLLYCYATTCSQSGRAGLDRSCANANCSACIAGLPRFQDFASCVASACSADCGN